MYNENIKDKFIDSSFGEEKKTKNIRSMFNNIEKVEKKYNKDCYYISYIDISKELLNHIILSSYKVFYDHIYYLKRYKEWCMMNEVFGEMVPIAGLTEATLHEIYAEVLKEVLIRTRLEFDDYLNIIFKTYNLNDDYITDDDFLMMFFLMLYNGVPEKAIVSLKINDVHITSTGDVFIQYNNTTIEIKDAELKTLLKKRLSKSHYGYLRNYGHSKKHLIFEMSNKLIDFVRVKDNKQKLTILKHNKLSIYKNELFALNPKYESALNSTNLYICGTMSRVKASVMKNSKLKRKDIFEWFFKSEISNRWKREQIIEIYNEW